MPTNQQDFGRTGAYAVIRDGQGRVLLVEANGGRLYLPGGRIEPGESAQTALLRELVEECGCAGSVLSRIGDRVQLVHDGRQTIRAHFFHAELGPAVGVPEHRMRWVSPLEAAASVHRAADAWAIRRLLQLEEAPAPCLEASA